MGWGALAAALVSAAVGFGTWRTHRWLLGVPDEQARPYVRVYEGLPIWRKAVTAAAVMVAPVVQQLMRLFVPPFRERDQPPFETRTQRGDFGEGRYLSDAELRQFEARGFTEPFQVLPREEALALKAEMEQAILDGQVIQGLFPGVEGPEREALLARHGIRETARLRGFDRHKNVPLIDRVLRRPELVERVASILGPDVLMWRSQVFPRAPGGAGTPLHFATGFGTNKGDARILVPSERFDRDIGLMNLSAWIAMTDVTVDHAPLTLVPGSHLQVDKVARGVETMAIAHALTPHDARMMVLTYLVGVTDQDLHPMFDMVRRSLNLMDRDLETDQQPIVLRAGEAILFTSKCLHGSFANQADSERFALVGRFTTPDVDIYPGASPVFRFARGIFPLPIELERETLRPVQVHGDCSDYLARWPRREDGDSDWAS